MQQWKSTRGNCFPKFCPEMGWAGGAALFDLRAMFLFDSFRWIPVGGESAPMFRPRARGKSFSILCARNFDFLKINQGRKENY